MQCVILLFVKAKKRVVCNSIVLTLTCLYNNVTHLDNVSLWSLATCSVSSRPITTDWAIWPVRAV